jgi:protein SCO1/2
MNPSSLSLKQMVKLLKIILSLLTVEMFFLFQPAQMLAHVEQAKDQYGIGIDQKLGEDIPIDLTFHDEEGNRVSLRQLIHTPTLLVLVYYHCPNVCSLLLQNVADLLNKLPAEPGKEYTVLAISFDEKEKPPLALQRKEIYLKMIEKPFPRNAWRFLTGDKENIHELTSAVGFHFKRVGEDFQHPVSLIVLSPGGKIIRYMYGSEFLPFDAKMALIEASQGRTGPAISKILRFCFSYDPKGQKLVFNTLKVTGIVTLFFALSFTAFLFFKGRKKPAEEG